jgi:hypothetical protein
VAHKLYDCCIYSHEACMVSINGRNLKPEISGSTISHFSYDPAPVCNPACLRAAVWQPLPHGATCITGASLCCPSCSTRLVDHTGLGRAVAGPHHYRSLSRAAGPGLLLLHGAETDDPNCRNCLRRHRWAAYM